MSWTMKVEKNCLSKTFALYLQYICHTDKFSMIMLFSNMVMFHYVLFKLLNKNLFYYWIINNNNLLLTIFNQYWYLSWAPDQTLWWCLLNPVRIADLFLLPRKLLRFTSWEPASRIIFLTFYIVMTLKTFKTAIVGPVWYLLCSAEQNVWGLGKIWRLEWMCAFTDVSWFRLPHPTGTDVKEAQVICVSTGTKCINGEYMSDRGLALNDCHAEIIARRSLIRYLYSQLEFFLRWVRGPYIAPQRKQLVLF